ncbi:MAG: alanine racemase [Lachnospiraceae bacterium]|nr:alanine racemase [Lachnospiraceae bacterium]
MENVDKYYRVYAGINLDNIYINMCELKRNTVDGTQMVAVIKTDGYGHGAVPIAKTIDDLVAAYAVATIDEALNLRRHNITKPIYILGFIYEHRVKDAILNDIRMNVFDMHMGKVISDIATELGKKAYIHIKVDTGMSRIGFMATEESADIVRDISELPGVEIEGILTHFTASDAANKETAKKQLEKFETFNKLLLDRGVDIKIKHCSNSAGIIDMPMANMNEVRAGIALYGMYPSDEVNKKAVMLRPALELKSHVVYVKTVPAGTGISYGSTYITDKETKVATIPVGYGDGYPRNLSNKGYVLIKGNKCPILGRVCMDQFMVDVTDMDVAEGEAVTLIGHDGEQSITVEELSELAGTFNYEFVCDLGKRIPRVYYREGKIVCMKDYFIDEYEML